MPTLLDPTARDAILQRLRRLEPSSKARWGALTAPKMICHLADTLRVCVGDQVVKRVDTLASRNLIKWVVVYSPLPVPRGKIETAPEMLASGPTNWTEDVTALEKLIVRTSTNPAAAIHPFFGPLTPGGWGRLNWKHVDHHLRQFGC